MNDYLVKALAFDKHARIYATTTTNVLNEIGNRLNYFPSALDALGRVLSMGAMMGSMLKLEETLTIRIEGNGPIGKIICDSDAHGHIRAYCDNPHCHFEYADFRLNARATVGDSGVIYIIKDLKLKEPFIGATPIVDGELAKDFAYYFSRSEQVPSIVALGVSINTDTIATSSGGYIIQLLPNTPDSIIDEIEKRVNVLPAVSELLESGLKPEDIIKNIDKNAEILETVPVEFTCNCSKERFARGILSLGSKEIKDMIAEDGKAETVCHFCGEQFFFCKDELESLYQEALQKEKTKS